jgi:ABC-type uncharacterized transport system permease subunit
MSLLIAALVGFFIGHYGDQNNWSMWQIVILACLAGGLVGIFFGGT